MNDEDDKQTFRAETVRKLLQLFFKDKKTRVGSDALALATELLRIFVNEAAARSAQFAKADSSAVVTVEHLEKVLPQLLLDF
jgi:histone H3/H4